MSTLQLIALIAFGAPIAAFLWCAMALALMSVYQIWKNLHESH